MPYREFTIRAGDTDVTFFSFETECLAQAFLSLLGERDEINPKGVITFDSLFTTMSNMGFAQAIVRKIESLAENNVSIADLFNAITAS